jgi:hypothetical protein
MATLEELRLKNLRLKSEREAREEQKEIGRQRKFYEKENRKLSYPKFTSFLSNTKDFTRALVPAGKKVFSKIGPAARRINTNLSRELATTSFDTRKKRKQYAHKAPKQVQNILSGRGYNY